MPEPADDRSLLALHEIGLMKELREELAKMPHHRTVEFNQMILPECFRLVEAIGYRMAYEAAVEAGVEGNITNMYVASCVKLDSVWYAENGVLSRKEQRLMENNAIDVLTPDLESLLAQVNVGDFVRAPLVSDESWSEFVEGLETFGETKMNGVELVGCKVIKTH